MCMDKYPTIARLVGKPVDLGEIVLSQKTLLRSFRMRFQALQRLNEGKTRIESLYPNEHFSDQDIAFGYLNNNEFVVATDFASDVEVGYIAHIVMLVALGYAKDENDTSPKVDFKVRGIVKYDLSNDVIFWETPEELLSTPSNFAAMQACLKQLLDKGKIHTGNRVYGSGTGATLSIGTVGQLLRA
jgi:hypothetical protein